MKMILLTLVTLASSFAFATAAPVAPPSADPNCKEQSLVHFVSKGAEVPSETIGLGETCDDFGGNLVFTPKNHIRLYVNLNIAGTIDLDRLDDALDAAAATSKTPLAKLPRMPISIVDDTWILRTYGFDRDSTLSLDENSFFVKASVLREGRFEAFMRDFYAIAAPVLH